MKRIVPLMLLTLISVQTVYAKGISEDYALQVAQNFYSQTTGKAVAMSLAEECVITDSITKLNEIIYYVFNAPGNGGFVIISGDDRVKPVLGYNTTGQFSPGGAPAAVTSWLSKYSKQITWTKANVISAPSTVTAQWNNYYNNMPVNQSRSSAIGPFLTTTWDQDLYYNALCPYDPRSPAGFGGYVPTGCGATAMAQIMRYWSYPATGTGGNSYTCAYGTLSAYFDSTTYNWANMPNSVTGANEDVATLMYDCGVAVDMNYNASESSSYLLIEDYPAASCQLAYTTYFGYDISTVRGLKQVYYNETYWVNEIQSELSNGRPIQYGGSGPQGGHTWVLDGMDANGNFHMNWGWSGTDDGYYSIDAIDPDSSAGYIFNNGEEMIVGIQPSNIAPDTSNLQLYAAITISPNPISFDQIFTVNTDLLNDGAAAFSGYYCAALFDSNGTFIRYIGPILTTGSEPLPAGDHYNGGLSFEDTTQAITVPGSYIIGIYYEPVGSNTWALAGISDYPNPVYVTISGPQDFIALYSDITVSPPTLVQGQQATVSVSLINDGTNTYYGEYEAVLLDLAGNFVQQIGAYTESNGLPVNYAYTPALSFSTGNVTAPQGQYILAIAENPSGSNYWYYCGGQTYQNPVLVDVVNSSLTSSVNDVSLNHLNLYPNPAHNNVTVDAGEMTGHYQLQIFNAIGQQVGDGEGILTGQKLTEYVAGLPAGIYMLQLKTELGTMNGRFVVR